MLCLLLALWAALQTWCLRVAVRAVHVPLPPEDRMVYNNASLPQVALHAREALAAVVDYCDACQRFKPHATHHCRVCKICVMNFDHHCHAINK